MHDPAATSSPSLSDRLRSTGESVRCTFDRLLDESVSGQTRPVQVAERLAIDKTLTGRLARSLKAGDAMQVLHLCPAPHGLGIVIEAAKRRGASKEACSEARRAVEAFQSLLDEFPGGRADLDAALSSWLPDARLRDERRAKQAAYKAMSSLLGHSADGTYTAMIVQPGEDEARCDVASVGCSYGVRRMRVDRPLRIAGFRRTAGDRETIDSVQTLEGRAPKDPRELLVPELSEHIEKIRIVEEPDRLQFTLDGDQPGINVPVTLAKAYLSRGEWCRYARPGFTHEWWTNLPRIPTRIAVFDVFLRDDVYPDYRPNVSSRIEGLSVSWDTRSEEFDAADEIDLTVDQLSLGRGIARIASGDLPKVRELVSAAFDRLGWDADRFRAYRFQSTYPVPSVSYTTWFPLPPPPTSP